MNSNQAREKLEDILLSDNIEKTLKEEKIIFDIIPELINEKGFDQKNKYHCYDVWEHTIHVIKNSKMDVNIRLILLLHDIGKPFSYQEDGEIRHFKGHAEKSAEISKKILERLGYDNKQIDEICFFISNHATTIKEEILDDGNLEMYTKLLYIQYCDASGYAPEYAKQIINKLDTIKAILETKKQIKNSKLKKESEYSMSR